MTSATVWTRHPDRASREAAANLRLADRKRQRAAAKISAERGAASLAGRLVIRAADSRHGELGGRQRFEGEHCY